MSTQNFISENLVESHLGAWVLDIALRYDDVIHPDDLRLLKSAGDILTAVEHIARLVRNAEAARNDPGEDISGLSDDEFLVRLLGVWPVNTEHGK